MRVDMLKIKNALKAAVSVLKSAIVSGMFILLGVTNAMEQNQILEQYPNGWTSMRDVENFREDLYEFYYGCDDQDLSELEEDQYKKAIEEKRQQGLKVDASIKPIIETLYERTAQNLGTEKTDLVLSILALGADWLSDCSYYDDIEDCFHEACASLSSLRDALAAKYKPATAASDEFIGKSIWSVQAECIRKLQAAPSVDIRNIGEAYTSNDFSLVAIDLCLDILRPKYNDFVNTHIVPVLKGYNGIEPGRWGIE